MVLSRVDQRISLDEVYFRLRLKTKSGNTLVFNRGWGSNEDIDSVCRHWDDDAEFATTTLSWKEARASRSGVKIFEESFGAGRWGRLLPRESHTVHALLVMPESARVRGAVAMAPTSREIGFKRRLQQAVTLSKSGVASLLLDNPLMGERRPADQYKTVINWFSEYPVMLAACVEENVKAMSWLRENVSENVWSTGVSQGGYTAAAAALTCGFPAGSVCVATPHSGEPVLIDGIPGRICAWDTLDRTCPGAEDARTDMQRVFEATRLDKMRLRGRSARFRLVAANRDKYVPRYSYELLEQRWGDRAVVEWANGGHVSTILEGWRQMTHLNEAIEAGVAELEAMA